MGFEECSRRNAIRVDGCSGRTEAVLRVSEIFFLPVGTEKVVYKNFIIRFFVNGIIIGYVLHNTKTKLVKNFNFERDSDYCLV